MRADDLTPTQQRVLDLISEGKTNYEIGQALGLTLDGAKYHVSELFSKLGVDSREEAAAWWRSQQALARRLSGAMRSSVAKWSAVAAVGAGTVAAMFLVWQAAMDDEPEPIPEIQVAFIQGGTDGGLQRILVVNQDGGERNVGRRGMYGVVSWSPDGRNLMALELGTRQRVWILDLVAGASASWIQSDFQAFAWSPDSRYLAVLGEDTITVHDAEGNEVAVLRAALSLRTGQTLVPVSWSPDSKFVVAGGQEKLAVLSLDGDQTVLDLPGGINEIGAVFLEWHGPSRLALLYLGASSGMWTTDVAAAVPEWEAAQPEDFKGPVERGQRDDAQAAAGHSHPLHCASATADGAAFASVFLAEDRRSVDVVVVERGSGLTVIEAPAGVSPISLRPCIAVVLAP